MKKQNKVMAILFLMQMYSTTDGLNKWCGPYDTFCLFSGGIETRVSDLSEAQFKCSETKDDSWPVELGDERIKEVFIEFIHNYSISNVILNAFNRNGTWYWKKNNIIVQNVPSSSLDENSLFYNDSGDESLNKYSLVCMTSCHANWTDINQIAFTDGNAYHYFFINTLQECKDLCETNVTCSSINWVYGSSWHGCWLFKYPYNASTLGSKLDTSHHVVDRSVKSFERCIGKGKEHSGSNGNEPKTNTIAILVAIATALTALTFIIVVVTLCLTKPKSGFRLQQDEDKLSQTIDNFDNIQEFISREPNRYLGPRGDQYTEVIKNDKSYAGTLKKCKV